MQTDTKMQPASPSDAIRQEWRSLTHLRDRVEAAANEIERLRTENAVLAQRLLELQNGRSESEAAHTFGDGEDAATLRKRIEGFIKSIDEILEAPASEETANAKTNE